MAKPTKVRVDPDELGSIAIQVSSLYAEIVSCLDAMDQSLEYLADHWAGGSEGLQSGAGHQVEFYQKVVEAQAYKGEKLKGLDLFVSSALANAPFDYRKLEELIESETKKLVTGYSEVAGRQWVRELERREGTQLADEMDEGYRAENENDPGWRAWVSGMDGGAGDGHYGANKKQFEAEKQQLIEQLREQRRQEEPQRVRQAIDERYEEFARSARSGESS